MAGPDTTCCPAPPPPGEARAAAAAAACERELAEMALTDPTLSSCCARDLKEQRQAARLRAALAAADRAAARERERDRAVVIGLQGAVSQQQQQQQQRRAANDNSEDSDFGDDYDDSEADPQLKQLREARMAELRRRAAERRSDASAGFGRLNDSACSAVVEAARGSGAARCVVHLAAEGHEAGAQLDERLAELARGLMPSFSAEAASRRRRRPHKERGGVLFLRAPVGAAAAPSAAAVQLCRDLGLCGVGGMWSLPRGALPALVVLAGGEGGDDSGDAPPMVVQACAPVARFCAEGGGASALSEDRVDKFLRAAGVLASGGAAAERSDSRDGDEEEEEEDDDEEGGGKPCQLCGRTYPHEHVRAVYGRREDDDDDEDRSDGE